MIYLFYGDNQYLIDKEIKKILTDKKIEAINISKYDLENALLSQIIDDALTISLFADKKAIIVDNAYIFTGTTKKEKLDLTLLEEYINNFNPDTFLFFIVNNIKLDERKKIYKGLKKTGIIKVFNKKIDLTKTVISLFDDYKVSKETINLLIDRVGDDLNLLENEIAKIKLYKDQDFNVTDEDIIKLTTKKMETDIFKLIENIVLKNKEKSLEVYSDMLKQNEEPIKIIIMLANEFRLLYQVKELIKKGHTENDITKTLGVHPYRVKLALSKGRNYNSEMLLSYLNKLADLDANIKTGKINPALSLELFIINL